jgi:hypothetical protein
VTVTDFIELYPEMCEAGTPLITAKLAEATLMVDASVWGDKADMGVGLTCAELLAHSPYGHSARLVDKEGDTVYRRRLEMLKRLVSGGFRVI